MVPATVEVIKKLKNHILTHHNMFLTTDHDPLFYIIEAAKKLKDAIELQKIGIKEEVEKIEVDKKNMLATFQDLSRFSKTYGITDSYLELIENLQCRIDRLKVKQVVNADIYTAQMKAIVAEIEKKTREVQRPDGQN